MLLEIKNLSYAYADKILYENASFKFSKGDHIGLVGQNGCGKTTLLSIIRGETIPDSGSIRWQKNIDVGYLDQYVNISGNLTVLEYLRKAFDHLYEIEKELNNLYSLMTTKFTEEIFEKSAEYQTLLEDAGFYQIESEILKVSSGLGINAIGLDKKLDQLSGGQKSKVILSKLLLQKPHVLLMDEPTNFLDREHIDWLKIYLKNFKGSFIVISHNFNFLDEITNSILDIEARSINKYPGNFSEFLKLKDIKRENYIKNFKSQQKQIKKYEDYIEKNRARASTARLAQSRAKALSKIKRIPPLEGNIKPNFSFKSLTVDDKKALIVKDLKVGYTSAILPRINFEVNSQEKIVITGFNGIGKSTLLKTLVEKISPISGWFYFSENTHVSYFEQEFNWKDSNMHSLDYLSDLFPDVKQSEIRKNLARCGLKSEYVLRPLKTLSGGEQAKVKICYLMLKESNFLILDEPTNHLDNDSKEILKRELSNWKGALILVSHERKFYENWCNRVINITK